MNRWPGASPEQVRSNVADGLGGLTRGLHRITKPIIGAVNGWALAGGWEEAEGSTEEEDSEHDGWAMVVLHSVLVVPPLVMAGVPRNAIDNATAGEVGSSNEITLLSL